MAGGLGRAIGVDPVLVRVGFVILTIFGGFGALLYVLGWLLLPADGDEVSAAESLIGRGRSSVPPILAVGLAIVALISLTSIFSWGLPFWPLVIGGVIAFIVVRKHRAASCARTPSGSDWGGSTNPDAWDRWGEQAGRWGQQAGDWVNRQPWTGGGPGGGGQPHDGTQDSAAQGPAPQSPFDRPAFWDEAPTGTDRSASGRGDNDGADDIGGPTGTATRTPPEWDPLGVAPFAWDLPEPAPAPEPPPVQQHRDGGVVTRVTVGLALLAGGVATGGIFAGWWTLPWAGVAAIALTVIATGLFIGALRGRGHGLIGPGIFLSLVTVALAVTGLDARAAYGEQRWAPATTQAVESEYVINGGQGVLDLSQLTVPAGQTVGTEVEVRAGQAAGDRAAGRERGGHLQRERRRRRLPRPARQWAPTRVDGDERGLVRPGKDRPRGARRGRPGGGGVWLSRRANPEAHGAG